MPVRESPSQDALEGVDWDQTDIYEVLAEEASPTEGRGVGRGHGDRAGLPVGAPS